MEWELTPEEITDILEDYSPEDDTSMVIALAQARKMLEWLEGECESEEHRGWLGDSAFLMDAIQGHRLRMDCPFCWQATKEEIGG